MADFHRRRATREELEQGQEEIRLANERLKVEAEQRGELPIQNGPEDETVGTKGETSSPKEDKKDEPLKGTPTKPSTEGSGTKLLRPPTDPPPDLPTVQPGENPSNFSQQKMIRQKGEVTSDQKPGVSEVMMTPAGQQAGAASEGGPGQYPQTPLFSEDQVRHFAALQNQAAWMYGPSQSVFTPALQRPQFLELDASRAAVAALERDVEFLKEQAVKEREEKEEYRKQIQMLLEENKLMRAKFEDRSTVQQEEEPRFSTPEEQVTKDGPGSAAEDEWLKRRKIEVVETPKEAARPPWFTEAAGHFPPKEAGRPPKFAEAAERPPPKEAERPSASEAKPKSANAGGGASAEGGFTEKSMEFMMLMVESMREMRKKVVEGRDEPGMVRGVEVVRNGVPDLPALAAWSPSQGPLQLGDWLLTLEPIVADLSTTSELWWSLMVKSAERWYEAHMALSPLDRVQHEVKPPAEVSLEKWARLERRMAAMLLKSLPEVVKEELVSSRRLSVFGILTQLLLTYCPGGVLEKQTLLKNLEDPAEVTTLAEAPAAIRRWMRWKLRTQEVGAVTPDPSILLKGLTKLTKRVVEGNKELALRINLMRNSLGIDTRPTDQSLGYFASHLLAEVEQVSLSERRAASVVPAKGDVKLKSLEMDRKPKGGDKQQEGDKEKLKCRFFLTESGCRKGRDCKFSHDLKDDKRRCYACGSVDHLSSSCPRSRGQSTETSPVKPRVAKAEGEEKSSTGTKDTEVSSQSSQGDVVKDLLEEANKMLKSLSTSSTPNGNSSSSVQDEERKNVMERLQQQLKSMKTFKMKRMSTGSDVGLVDSGATHALRPQRDGEAVQGYPLVEVSLADGRSVRLPMSPGGSMIAPSTSTEPILPMGLLAQVLQCRIAWINGTMEIEHPQRGNIPVTMRDGCPHLAKNMALELISEIEDRRLGVPKEVKDFSDEVEWMHKLVQQHPVLSKLPDRIKSRMVISPGDWSALPGNRHMRKKWRRDGVLVHLFAGPDAGFTLKKAMKQQGGPVEKLMEVDIQRGAQHDVLSDQAVYSGLVRVALEGKLLGLIGGPNCRTRSVLRHIPIPGQPTAPRPIRRWGGEEYGIEEATAEELRKLYEDDVLMWRFIFLFMLAQYMRKARKIEGEVAFTMEQPASPKDYLPQVVSWWDTDEWKLLRGEFGFEEVTFLQGEMGGPSPKPTTFGGNLQLNVEAHRKRGPGSHFKVSSSADLSRWAPGVMSMVSTAVIQQTFKSSVRCGDDLE